MGWMNAEVNEVGGSQLGCNDEGCCEEVTSRVAPHLPASTILYFLQILQLFQYEIINSNSNTEQSELRLRFHSHFHTRSI